MPIKRISSLFFISIMLTSIFMSGCAINFDWAPISNEKLFIDGVLSSHEGDLDAAYELFGQIEQSHPLYPVAQEEMKKIDSKRAQPKTPAKPVKKISARKLGKYNKYMGEAKVYLDKKDYDLSYLSYHLAQKQATIDKDLFGKAQALKKKIEPQALSIVKSKLQKADALESKQEFQKSIDMLRPIAQFPLMSKEIQDKLASVLHKFALVNYQKSKYKIAADLFKEEYKYRPKKSVLELSRKARKLSEALESN